MVKFGCCLLYYLEFLVQLESMMIGDFNQWMYAYVYIFLFSLRKDLLQDDRLL